jgi:hypothetical protein
MIELNVIFLLLSAAVLGVFLGAQIAEACLFIPIWKKMSADDFFEQHHSVRPLLLRFFAPLTIAATVIPLIAVLLHWIINPNQSPFMWVMGVSTLLFFSTYFLYFKMLIRNFLTVCCQMTNYQLNYKSGVIGTGPELDLKQLLLHALSLFY